MVRAIVMAFMVLYKYLIFVSTTSNTLRAHTAASVTAYVHVTTVEGATPSLESVAVRPVSRVTSVRMDAHLVSKAQTIGVHLVSQTQTIAVHLVNNIEITQRQEKYVCESASPESHVARISSQQIVSLEFVLKC